MVLGTPLRTTDEGVKQQGGDVLLSSIQTVPPAAALEVRSSEWLIRGATGVNKRNKNLDLWDMMDRLVACRFSRITYSHVPGHAGLHGKEAANDLAVRAASLDKRMMDARRTQADGRSGDLSAQSVTTSPCERRVRCPGDPRDRWLVCWMMCVMDATRGCNEEPSPGSATSSTYDFATRRLTISQPDD